jgi:hypothetical protein
MLFFFFTWIDDMLYLFCLSMCDVYKQTLFTHKSTYVRRYTHAHTHKYARGHAHTPGEVLLVQCEYDLTGSIRRSLTSGFIYEDWIFDALPVPNLCVCCMYVYVYV